jgi:hypothetical protein
MASPIIGSGKLYCSYNNLNDVILLPISASYKATHTMTPKKVLEPRSEYHTWLETEGKNYDCEQQRDDLINNRCSTSTNSSTVVPDVPQTLKLHVSHKDMDDYDKLTKELSSTQLKISTMPSNKLSDRRAIYEKRKMCDKIRRKLKCNPVYVNNIDMICDENDEDIDDENEDDEDMDGIDLDDEKQVTDLMRRVRGNRVNQIADIGRLDVIPIRPSVRQVNTVPPARHVNTVPTIATSNNIANLQDNVFMTLISLQWRDKDEEIMKPTRLNNIAVSDWIKIFPTMKQLADDLRRCVSDMTGALESMTEEERYNFLFHVIAKGETMYYQSIADPDFCLYLLDQYQNLYSMIVKKCKIVV